MNNIFGCTLIYLEFVNQNSTFFLFAVRAQRSTVELNMLLKLYEVQVLSLVDFSVPKMHFLVFNESAVISVLKQQTSAGV